MDILQINKAHKLYSDLILQNPINRDYALMRPTLVYSLIQCLAYNYSMNNTNLALFEIGHTYYKDKTSDTGTRELNMLGFIMSGIRLSKGWGINKDIKYSYYDVLNYINILFDKFGGNFELKEGSYPFCKNAYDIIYCGEPIGFIGKLNKKVISKIKNVKLIKDDVFYCEMDLSKLNEKSKKLKFESKYPGISRVYNLLVNKSVLSKQVEDVIYSSSNLIRNVTVKDIYIDDKMNKEQHALLYEVKFCSKDFTITTEQVEKIEKEFLNKLAKSLGVSIK